jgi:hypothetical protein
MNEEHLAIDKLDKGLGEDMRSSRRGVSIFESIHADHLRKLDPEMFELLSSDDDLEDVRGRLFDHLSRLEFSYHSTAWRIDALERVNALYCIQVLKNLISARNEKASGCSTLTEMARIVKQGEIKEQDRALFIDFYHIVKGAVGQSGLTSREGPDLSNIFGREAARKRSDFLDIMSERCYEWINKYPAGMDAVVSGGERRTGSGSWTPSARARTIGTTTSGS